MKARITLKLCIHPPDFGIFLSALGNIAKSEKGNAKAKAKPNIPIAGATHELPLAASTNNVPIIGPVQLKLTNTRVNAMNRIERKPVVLLDLLFIALLHDAGSVISKSPKNESAKITRIAKNIKLATALVLRLLSAEAPKITVTSKPKPT